MATVRATSGRSLAGFDGVALAPIRTETETDTDTGPDMDLDRDMDLDLGDNGSGSARTNDCAGDNVETAATAAAVKKR